MEILSALSVLARVAGLVWAVFVCGFAFGSIMVVGPDAR